MVILFNVLSIITSAASIVKNWPFMLAVRFLYSFCAGAIVSIAPKVVGETVPEHLMDYGFGASTNMIINVSIMYTMLLGMGYPVGDPDKDPAIKAELE